MNATEARNYVIANIREVGKEEFLSGVMEHYNCRVADVDEGNVYIGDAQKWRKLSDDELVDHVEWDMSR